MRRQDWKIRADGCFKFKIKCVTMLWLSQYVMIWNVAIPAPSASGLCQRQNRKKERKGKKANVSKIKKMTCDKTWQLPKTKQKLNKQSLVSCKNRTSWARTPACICREPVWFSGKVGKAGKRTTSCSSPRFCSFLFTSFDLWTLSWDFSPHN